MMKIGVDQFDMNEECVCIHTCSMKRITTNANSMRHCTVPIKWNGTEWNRMPATKSKLKKTTFETAHFQTHMSD